MPVTLQMRHFQYQHYSKDTDLFWFSFCSQPCGYSWIFLQMFSLFSFLSVRIRSVIPPVHPRSSDSRNLRLLQVYWNKDSTEPPWFIKIQNQIAVMRWAKAWGHHTEFWWELVGNGEQRSWSDTRLEEELQIKGWQVCWWFQKTPETCPVGWNAFDPVWFSTWNTLFWCQCGGATFLYGKWWKQWWNKNAVSFYRIGNAVCPAQLQLNAIWTPWWV